MRVVYPQEVTHIYGLIDPRTGECRYVGKANNPERRLRDHLRTPFNTHKYAWLTNLLKAGLRPTIQILEEVQTSVWQEAECFWIAYMKFMGADLTNSTIGGDGLNPTPEMAAKMRAGCQEPERRRKISSYAKARYADPLERERLITMAQTAGRDPVNKQKASVRMKEVMNTPERKLKSAQVIKAQLLDPNSKMNSVEAKEKLSKSRSVNSKAAWADPERVRRMTDPLRTSEARAANSARTKALHQNPEYVARKKERENSAEFRKKVSDSIKAHWIIRREKKKMQDVVCELFSKK